MESRSSSPSLPLLFLLIIFSINAHLTTASNLITQTESLTGPHTITSPGGMFELGFFTPGESHNYYIGIWYKQFQGQTVVWVANRETPLPNTTTNSILKISTDGNLVLLNSSNLPIWSTNISSIPSNYTIAALLETGNLVLRDGNNESVIHWESFDHPTDTFLPHGKVGLNKITGESIRLTSWRSPEDPAPGPFSNELDPSGRNQFLLLWNRTAPYWASGDWNGEYFDLIPEMSGNGFYHFVDDKQTKYFSAWPTSSSLIERQVLDYTGVLRVYEWSGNWNLFFSVPHSPCDVYSPCGPFARCNAKNSTFCACLHGFEPKNLGDWNLGSWSSGCARRTPLNCQHNGSSYSEKDGFLAITVLKLPDPTQSSVIKNATECELACLNNCSCIAYSFKSNCSIWDTDLLNLQQPSGADGEGEILHLRLAASDLPGSNGKFEVGTTALIGMIVGAFFILAGVSLLIWICRQRTNVPSFKAVRGSLTAFRYRDLQTITKNFSEKLGGGGFGSVFKGYLPDSTIVAVKKLEGLQQGEKQFRTEVSTIGAIQHVHLIRLRGFCSEADKKLLVYDYMPNGSLNSHLFKKNSLVLSWSVRYQISIGIARGLDYLHEKCRDRIIHCDIKPENILLDSDFCPKVADFGLAKLIGREFSHVLTTLRGTRGYLAPEWLSGQAITPKADVYSYGMMVFEIISGRRNAEQFIDGDDESMFFPAWAVKKINHGEIHYLLDGRLEGNANMEELRRLCKVAGWCIQDDENNRPTMGLIVQILEGVLEVDIPPLPTSLQVLIGDKKLGFVESSTESSQFVSAVTHFSEFGE